MTPQKTTNDSGYSHYRYIQDLQRTIENGCKHVPDFIDKLVILSTLYIQLNQLFNTVVDDVISDDIPYRKHTNPFSLSQGIASRDFFVELATHVTAYIGSILKDLHITSYIRAVEYQNRGFFQHIYIVIPINQDFYSDTTNTENYIVLDPTSGKFNIEAHFTNFEDYKI